MTASASKTSTPSRAAQQKAARAERLAAQLKANIARRKQNTKKEADHEQG